MKLYRSYFFRGKDPVIAELKQQIGNAVSSADLSKIEKQGGPSASAMSGWFHGATRRPQNATIEAAGRALGLKRVWVTDRGNSKKREH